MTEPPRPPAIRVGDTGPAVRDLQRRLRRLGVHDAPPDGAFGSDTLEAVRRFQREQGLAADGVVGPETWRRLVEAGWALGDRLLLQGRDMLRGEDVRELQHRLGRLGFHAGPEDGIFGPLVRAAVEEFQRNVGLKVDGVAGPVTIAALRRLHRDHQGGQVARLREREALRRLSGRGLAGARIAVDPAHGPDDPGETGPGGSLEHEVTWQLARRVAARLSAHGAHAMLCRGARTTPQPEARARFANEQGADLLLSLAASGSSSSTTPSGPSSYYFGSATFVSESGALFAELCQAELVEAGWLPDGRCHPVTWTILRETRMPAVVIEPGFLTNPADEARLLDPAEQDTVAEAVVRAVERFFSPADGAEARATESIGG